METIKLFGTTWAYCTGDIQAVFQRVNMPEGGVFKWINKKGCPRIYKEIYSK